MIRMLLMRTLCVFAIGAQNPAAAADTPRAKRAPTIVVNTVPVVGQQFGSGNVQHITCAGDICTIIAASDTEAQPNTCLALDGSGDLEPCAWQESTKKAAAARAEEARDKHVCRAKGCRVHRKAESCAALLMLSPPCREWFCDCDWKPPTATATKTSVHVDPPRKASDAR